MILQKEYYQRHGIKDPVIVHQNQLDLILKSKHNNGKFYFSAQWQHSERPRPGTYRISQHVLSYNEINGFKQIGEIIDVSWDEYEEYLITWIESSKSNFKAPRTPIENILWWWEGFLFICDEQIGKVDNNFLTLISKSVDYNEEEKVRFTFYEKSTELLRWVNIGLYNKYNEKFKPLGLSYPQWLTELLNSK